MSLPLKLTGGNLVRRDTQRPPTSPYAEPPFLRLFDPLDIYASAACMTLLRQAAVLNLHSPDMTHVEVAVREVDGVKYILLAPTDSDDLRKQELSTRPDQGGGYIRTADDVLLAAGIASMPGVAYRMDAFLVEDDDLKWVVAATWTTAKREVKATLGAAESAPPTGPAAAASMQS